MDGVADISVRGGHAVRSCLSLMERSRVICTIFNFHSHLLPNIHRLMRLWHCEPDLRRTDDDKGSSVYCWSNWRLSVCLQPEYDGKGFVEGATEPNNKDGFGKLAMELRKMSGVSLELKMAEALSHRDCTCHRNNTLSQCDT